MDGNDPLLAVSPMDAQIDLPGMIDRRMARQGERLLANLTAWAGVLDALGWNVALRLPGDGLLLCGRTRSWAERQPGYPQSWQEISSRLEAVPPARWLVCSPRAMVWVETGRLTETGSKNAELTKREAEVLGWLREGKTGPEIAIILGCAQRTVESHVARLYRKLGVHHRAELMFQTDTNTPG